MTVAIEARAIDVHYGPAQILFGLELQARRDRITAIIGPNGAGKSTALKAMFGLLPLSRGSVHLSGADVTGARPQDLVRRGVCFVSQGRAVFPSMTVEENLDMGAYLVRDKGLVAQRREEVYDRFERLRACAKQPAGSLSGGEQQMLAMGRALMVDPDILLLDEPSVGLAPKVVREVLGAIQAIRDDGKTIVMVEQNATMALKTCDDAYLMVNGRVRLHGKGHLLLADPQVQEIYLGGTEKGGQVR